MLAELRKTVFVMLASTLRLDNISRSIKLRRPSVSAASSSAAKRAFCPKAISCALARSTPAFSTMAIVSACILTIFCRFSSRVSRTSMSAIACARSSAAICSGVFSRPAKMRISLAISSAFCRWLRATIWWSGITMPICFICSNSANSASSWTSWRGR